MTQNQIQVFENREFGEIRTVEIDGQPWFVGKDVADVLAYKNTRDSLKVHVDIEDKADVVIHDGRQNRKMVIVNESGLYSLILSSKLPSAKAFKRWVTSEVLPTIRKHGGYITDELLKTISEQEDTISEFVGALREERLALKEERAKSGVLQDVVAAISPKARYYDVILQCNDAIPVSIIAKDYGMTAMAFNKLLNTVGIQYKIRGTWLLRNAYANQRYTVSQTFYIFRENKSTVHTYWTQRGRKFLYDFLKRYDVLPEIERERSYS